MGDERLLGALELDDSYEVLSVLAEGPSGRTELVRLGGSGRLVRKRIPMRLANVAAWTALVGMDEELLPQVVSLYQLPDELVVVCEWVEGTPLGKLVAQKGLLPLERACALLADLCHAAGVLHAHGVIHRDIVPDNVIVDPAGRAHLIDLGIARVCDAEAPADTTALGTWGFAAPEQFGFAQTDARSDVYALGRLLAFMLTGAVPEASGSGGGTTGAPIAHQALAQVVAKACAFEPSARYQSADALARAAWAALVPGGAPASESVVGEARTATPAASASDAHVGTGLPSGGGGGISLRRTLLVAVIAAILVAAPFALRAVLRLRVASSAAESVPAPGVELSSAQRALVTNPTETYVIEQLLQVEGVESPAAVTKASDSNNLLDVDGGYTAAVYFISSLVPEGAVGGEDAVARGVKGGGSVEVFPNAEDAAAREAYLSSLDTGLLPVGSHSVCGTCVIRTSSLLSSQQQAELEAAIVAALTDMQ